MSEVPQLFKERLIDSPLRGTRIAWTELAVDWVWKNGLARWEVELRKATETFRQMLESV
jgi:hypothetical protein